MLRLKGFVTATLLLTGCVRSVSAEAPAGPVSLDFFFSAGCTECERVKRVVFPDLEARFEGLYGLAWHDMTRAETIPLLLAYRQRCHTSDNGRVSLVVDHTVFLSGYGMIATGLCDRVNEALIRRQSPDWTAPQPPPLSRAEAQSAVQAGVKPLTLSVVVLGGLLDGFNPCAISTLIFFMSVLTVAKAGRRTRLPSSPILIFVLNLTTLSFLDEPNTLEKIPPQEEERYSTCGLSNNANSFFSFSVRDIY